MFAVFFYNVGAYLAKRLPQRVSESITTFLANTQYIFRRRAKQAVRINLAIALNGSFDERTIHHTTRNVITNFGRSIYYFLRLPCFGREELLRRCESNGLQKTARNIVKKSGFLIVGPHVGPWETGAACISAMGIPIHTVVLGHPSPRVTRFFERQRKMTGVRSIPLGGSGRALKHALAHGECVALLVDRPYGKRNKQFRWFDEDITLPAGHGALAVSCDVPIMTAVCVFDGNGGVKFDYGGPYYPDRSLSIPRAAEQLETQCLRDMERYIRSYPDQWFDFQPLGRRAS